MHTAEKILLPQPLTFGRDYPRAGFSERTARRFDADPTPPSQRKIVHGRTVADPIEGHWQNDLLPLLERDSTLQAITLLRHLQSEHPLAFPDDCIRRTLERRVRQWRALNGPERDIIFRQTPSTTFIICRRGKLQYPADWLDPGGLHGFPPLSRM